MKSQYLNSNFQDEQLYKELLTNKKLYNLYKEDIEKIEIVLEQDLRYRLSCIIDKLGLLENQEKLDAELDSKN